MGPSEKSFNQVRSILGKLDRSIDEARARRTQPPAPPPAPRPVAPQNPLPLPGPKPMHANPGQNNARSSPGRATPIPSNHQQAQRRPA
jgi:hypothetical protein